MDEFSFCRVLYVGSIADGIRGFFRRYFYATFFDVTTVFLLLWVYSVGFYRDILLSKKCEARYVFERFLRNFCTSQRAADFCVFYCKRLGLGYAILAGINLQRFYFCVPNHDAGKSLNKICYICCEQQTFFYSYGIFYFYERAASTIRLMTSDKLTPSRLASALSQTICGLVNTIDRWMIAICASVDYEWTNLYMDYQLVKRPS